MNLMNLSEAGGCGCKVAPDKLQRILDALPPDPTAALVGLGDDAAVIKLTDSLNLVATVDFFSPVVDTCWDFGRIAAANALSDVFAMGGRPVSALSILAIPDQISETEISEILSGASSACESVGIGILGGHTIRNQQPLFGLSVNGVVDSHCIKRNAGALVGDLIYLTKPLGVGVMSTAIKKEQISASDKAFIVAQMSLVNTVGLLFGQESYITAMTDVTGFGLGGHLLEVCRNSGVSATIDWSRVPLVPNVFSYLSFETSGGRRNWKANGAMVSPLLEEQRILLFDPQTNGGLLVFVRPQSRDAFEALLSAAGLGERTTPIGVVTSSGGGPDGILIDKVVPEGGGD